jgi:hypothetical protein
MHAQPYANCGLVRGYPPLPVTQGQRIAELACSKANGPPSFDALYEALRMFELTFSLSDVLLNNDQAAIDTTSVGRAFFDLQPNASEMC